MQNHPFLKGPADSSSGRKNHQTLWSLEVSQKNCPRKLDIIWSRNVKFHRSLEFDKGGLELRSGECHDVVSLNEFFEVSISCSFGGG